MEVPGEVGTVKEGASCSEYLQSRKRQPDSAEYVALDWWKAGRVLWGGRDQRQ